MKGPQAVNEVYEVIKYFVVHNEKVREECDIEWRESRTSLLDFSKRNICECPILILICKTKKLIVMNIKLFALAMRSDNKIEYKK